MGSMSPPSCPVDVSSCPALTREQAGHIRHIHNLSTQLDGQWHHMGAQEPRQEFLDAYRYQLATMAYAVGVTHYHHQPLLRSVYKKLFRKLIHKMLCRDVWLYWFNTSLGGVRTDPSLKVLRTPWADPIVKENIMYSGHLLLMVSLYAMLFDDPEFEEKDSMVFNWDPLFFGLGPETFSYSTATLQEAIEKEMERNGYVGVCCEPNMVFVVCNQFPIIGMRYNDVRHGTHVIEDLLPRYKDSWVSKGGMVRENGLFPDAWLEKQDFVLAAQDPGWTAWAAAFMNTWNGKLLRELFPKQSEGFVTSIDGKTRVHPGGVGNAIRKLVAEEKVYPNDAGTVERAKSMVRAEEPSKFPYTKPVLGYILMWLSELGQSTQIAGLLEFVDEKLKPTWEKGGLYYPRNDEAFDEDMEWTHMDPFTGNAAIAYARLNVEDGQKLMWEKPWTSEVLSKRPYVDEVELGQGVDFLRGEWDEGAKAVVVTMRSWDGKVRSVRLVVKNLEVGEWVVWIDGISVRSESVGKKGEIEVIVQVGGEEVDVVVVKQE
ncbi:hypothetical protein LTR15_012498 [Elasticomyces elasticus]|nr:hypothetical protein LTR15_012498 [Elasticomyces elasticus]